MNPDGTYTYTPNANYNGIDVFNYQLCDGDGDCVNATVTITINPVNDVPVAVNDFNTTSEDTPVSGNASSNDTPSGDGGNTWTLVGPNGGAANGSVTMNSSGVYTYTPNINYSGTDVFSYLVCDVDGDCSTATVTITISPVNDPPNTDPYYYYIGMPAVNSYRTLNGGGNPPIPSGYDVEDCQGNCLLTGRSLIIDLVPFNSQLYYNGVLVVNGQRIDNFDPNLFQVKFTTVNSTSTSFQYSFVDSGNLKDNSPATYTLAWLGVLTVNGFNANASLTGNTSRVSWETLTEQNTSYFTVERSTDNVNFSQTGARVNAAGNSSDKRNYFILDDITSIVQSPVIYYRVRLEYADGTTRYSNTVIVRPFQGITIAANPNPFVSSISIKVNSYFNTSIEISLKDMSGKTIRRLVQPVNRNSSHVVLDNLEQLAAGIYILEITDGFSGFKSINKFLKTH
jgi:hypothetical protein